MRPNSGAQSAKITTPRHLTALAILCLSLVPIWPDQAGADQGLTSPSSSGTVIEIGSPASISSTSAAAAAAISATQSRYPTDLPGDRKERRKMGRRRYITRLKAELADCEKNGCDDTSRFVLLRNMLITYGLIGMRGSPEANAALEQYRAVLKRHPELAIHQPNETTAQRKMDEEAGKKENERRKRLAAFIPNDTRIIRLFQDANFAAVIYQYHIDFYRLTSGVELRRPARGSDEYRSGPPHAFRGPAEIPLTSVPLEKSMRFKYGLQIENENKRSNSEHSVWVCSDISTYGPSNSDERLVIGYRGIDWENESAEGGDFCGVISLGGVTVYRLPVIQHFPDTMLDLRYVKNEGKKAFLLLGALGDDGTGVDDEGRSFNIRETLIWEAPDQLHRFNVNGMSQDQIVAIWAKFGF